MSLSLGVLSQTKKLIFFSFAAIAYGWSADYLAITQLPIENAFTWIFSFILYDFLYYWFHRSSHQINFLWASHVVHHQSEEYNLTTALRQTSSSVFSWLFYIPSFLLGVPAEVFFISGALNLVYQFWVHTRLIGRLGWIESILVTPSHHRVHHGQNQQYIDKNHGGVFIIWDKLFSTFQPELDDEPVIYGVRRPVASFNPLWANLHTWWGLLQDAIATNKWQDKLKIWFMPTGWRPQDMEIQFPLVKNNPDKLIKFDPISSVWFKAYVLFQYLFCVIFAVLFIQLSKNFSFELLFLIWILISLPFVTIGLLLESRPRALGYEVVRIIVSIGAFIGLMKQNIFSEYLELFIASYFSISIIALLLIGLIRKSSTPDSYQSSASD